MLQKQSAFCKIFGVLYAYFCSRLGSAAISPPIIEQQCGSFWTAWVDSKARPPCRLQARSNLVKVVLWLKNALYSFASVVARICAHGYKIGGPCCTLLQRCPPRYTSVHFLGTLTWLCFCFLYGAYRCGSVAIFLPGILRNFCVMVGGGVLRCMALDF